MKALGKVLGLFFLGLLLLAVALGFTLTHLFSPSDYKDEIHQIVRDKVNLELGLKGDTGWSLLPWLDLELHDTSIASTATPIKPFTDLQMLGLSVWVLLLLCKDIQMSAVRVEGLNLDLVRDKQGKGNWENTGKPAQSQASSAPSATPPAADGKGAQTRALEQASQNDSPRTPIKLDIDSLNVNNARVTYTDKASGKQYSAESIELSTGAIREDNGTLLKLNAYLGTNQSAVRVKTELTGNLRSDTALRRYQLEDARFFGGASGEPLQGKAATFSAQGQLLFDQPAQIAEWNGLKLSVNQLRALGKLKARELGRDAKLSGGLSIAPMNLREFLAGVGVILPVMANANTLGKFKLNTRLAGSRNSLNLEDLKLGLDDTAFSGRFGIADFARQSLRAQPKGDKLGLDRYLPAKAKQAQDAASTMHKAEADATMAGVAQGNTPLSEKPTKQAWSDAPLPLMATLRKFDLDMALNFGRLTVEKLPIDDASLKLCGQGGAINLDDMCGGLYNGRPNAKANFDVRQDSAVLTATKHITNVPVERLLEVQGKKPPVKGLLDLGADIRTSDNGEKFWVDHLNGSACFSLINGVLFDANLEQQLCQGIATLNRKALAGTHGGKDMPFREFKDSLNLTNSMVSNPNLKVAIPGLAVSGHGDISLRALGVDYRVDVGTQSDKSDMPDPVCQVDQHYAGIEWPLLCRGPLGPGVKACRLDKEDLGKAVAKLAGNRLNEKLEEKPGDKVSPELKDVLKGLFNRK